MFRLSLARRRDSRSQLELPLHSPSGSVMVNDSGIDSGVAVEKSPFHSSWRPDECSTATTLSYARAMFESAQSGLPPPAEGVRAARHAVLQVTGLSHESWSIGERSPLHKFALSFRLSGEQRAQSCAMARLRQLALHSKNEDGLFLRLLQLRVLHLRFFQYGNVRVGIFPERQEVLISSLGFGGVARHGVSAGKAEPGERVQ